MNREQRRAAAKQAKKDGNPDMEEKITLFSKLSDECLTCGLPFDKKDKSMVQSWNVVVREEEEKVNLYCPECWNKAVNLLKDFKKHLEEKKRDDEGA
jgi:predicted RNA-binding Zn-ribbon protein involved in translation (DUF1610 family)